MTEGFRWASLLRERRRSGLETEISDCGRHHLISVRGRLTLETSPELLKELRKVVKRASHLKVRLRDVTFLDSSGISVLIQGLKLAQEKGVDYALVDPSPKVTAIMELSQLDQFFTIETGPEASCSEPS